MQKRDEKANDLAGEEVVNAVEAAKQSRLDLAERAKE